MLKIFSKKICPFLSLMIGTIGCGKKINQEASPNTTVVERQELPSALVINLETSQNDHVFYEIPKNGNILMPEKLQFSGILPSDFKVTVTYNISALDPDEFDYKCSYKKNILSSDLNLQQCYDSNGEIITQATEFELPIYYGKFISIHLDFFSPNLNISAIYTVDWK